MEKEGRRVPWHLIGLCPLACRLLVLLPCSGCCLPAYLLHGSSLPFRAGTSQPLPSAFHPLCLECSTVDHVHSHGFNLNVNTSDFQICSPLALPSTCDTFFYSFPLRHAKPSSALAAITKYRSLGDLSTNLFSHNSKLEVQHQRSG